MENIHIRLEPEEALFAKREFLNSQINALQTLKTFKNFKVTRKRELILRTRLRQSLSELSAGIEEMQKILPTKKEESGEMRLLQSMSKRKIRVSRKSEITGKREYKDIERELKEIREKLEKLG